MFPAGRVVHGKANPPRVYATTARRRFALLVRGTARRLTTMTARPDVIREYQSDHPSRFHPRPVWERQANTHLVRPPPPPPLDGSHHIRPDPRIPCRMPATGPWLDHALPKCPHNPRPAVAARRCRRDARGSGDPVGPRGSSIYLHACCCCPIGSARAQGDHIQCLERSPSAPLECGSCRKVFIERVGRSRFQRAIIHCKSCED